MHRKPSELLEKSDDSLFSHMWHNLMIKHTCCFLRSPLPLSLLSSLYPTLFLSSPSQAVPHPQSRGSHVPGNTLHACVLPSCLHAHDAVQPWLGDAVEAGRDALLAVCPRRRGLFSCKVHHSAVHSPGWLRVPCTERALFSNSQSQWEGAEMCTRALAGTAVALTYEIVVILHVYV